MFKLRHEQFDENFDTQATDAAFRAPDPIYPDNKQRSDWDLLSSTGGGEHPTMQLFVKMGRLEAIGERLYGRTRLPLRLESVAESGLLGV